MLGTVKAERSRLVLFIPVGDYCFVWMRYGTIPPLDPWGGTLWFCDELPGRIRAEVRQGGSEEGRVRLTPPAGRRVLHSRDVL